VLPRQGRKGRLIPSRYILFSVYTPSIPPFYPQEKRGKGPVVAPLPALTIDAGHPRRPPSARAGAASHNRCFSPLGRSNGRLAARFRDGNSIPERCGRGWPQPLPGSQGHLLRCFRIDPLPARTTRFSSGRSRKARSVEQGKKSRLLRKAPLRARTLPRPGGHPEPRTGELAGLVPPTSLEPLHAGVSRRASVRLPGHNNRKNAVRLGRRSGKFPWGYWPRKQPLPGSHGRIPPRRLSPKQTSAPERLGGQLY
jgi:hypothetical protein